MPWPACPAVSSGGGLCSGLNVAAVTSCSLRSARILSGLTLFFLSWRFVFFVVQKSDRDVSFCSHCARCRVDTRQAGGHMGPHPTTIGLALLF